MTQSWPLFKLGQVGFVVVVMVPVTGVGGTSVTKAVSWQLFASVMMTVYVPGGMPEPIETGLAPLVVTVGVQAKVKGAVPPLAVTVALPVVLPWPAVQAGLVTETVLLMAVGPVTATVCVRVQPRLSVTVTE